MASFCATGKWHDCKDVLHRWLMTGSMSTASSCPLSNESPTRWSHWRSRCCRPQCQHTSVTWSSQLFLVSLCDHLMPSCCLFQQREPSLHVRHFRWQLHTPGIHYHLTLDLVAFCTHSKIQEAPLSPRDRTMRRVSWNLANCHATVQKLLVRQVVNKSKLWSWKVKVGWCVINMCTQPWCVRVAFIVL